MGGGRPVRDRRRRTAGAGAAAPDSLVVEFVGLPGSGKSTIAAHTLARLRAAGLECDDLLEPVAPTVPRARRLTGKAGRCLLEVVRHPRQSRRLIAGIRMSGQRNGDLVHRTESWLVVRAVVRAARRRRGVHLIDQGMLQELCSVALRGDWRVELPGDERAPELHPDLVVRVGIDTPTAAWRLDQRPGTQSRLERLTTEQRTATLDRQRDEIEAIVAWSQARPGSRAAWVSVDGSIEPERSADDVVRAVRALVAARRLGQEIGSSTASPRAAS